MKHTNSKTKVNVAQLDVNTVVNSLFITIFMMACCMCCWCMC
ncbi:MAG: hypothetical protein V4677_01395 [Bacteroidota bacterium]